MSHTAPRTRSAAVKAARPVGTAELAALLAEDDNVDVYGRKGTARRIAHAVRVSSSVTSNGDTLDRARVLTSDRYGRTVDIVLHPSRIEDFQPVFVFSGDVVRWVREDA